MTSKTRSSPDFGSPDTTAAPEILDWGVLRAAAWPIETVDRFAAPALADLASAVIGSERHLAERCDGMLAALHRAVPELPDRDLRARVLALKRAVYAGPEPLDVPDDLRTELAAAAPALGEELEKECELRRRLGRQRAELEAAFASELSAQQGVLIALTVEPAFARALTVANRDVAAKWARRAGRPGDAGSRRTRDRRLEATVFHFLMRAAGRPTPQGAWAGVAPIGPAPTTPSTAAPSPASPSSDGIDRGSGPVDRGSGLAVVPMPARYVVTVELAPFAAVVAQLVRLPRYRDDYPLRLTPTAHRVDAGWCFETTTGGRGWSVVTDQLLGALVEAWSDGKPHTGPEVIEALTGSNPSSTGASPRLEERRRPLAGAVRHLLDLGVLQSDLHVPRGPVSVGAALDAIEARLAPPDRVLWHEVSERVATLCRQLGDTFEQLTADAVDEIVGSVRVEIGRLLANAGLDPAVPDPVVHVDLRLPFRATWDEGFRARVGEGVDQVLGFHRAEGVSEAFRMATLARLGCQVDPGHAVALLAMLRDVRPTHGRPAALALDGGTVDDRSWAALLRDRLRSWEAALEPVRSHPSHPLAVASGQGASGQGAPAGPAGAFVFSVSGDELWARWGRPQAALFVSRLAEALSLDLQEGEGPAAALRRRTGRWADWGVTAVEVVGDDPLSFNAAVRPSMSPLELHPHTGDGLAPSDLSVVVHEGRAWMRSRSGAEGWLVPTCGSAVAVGTRDSCSRVLFGLAMSHGWELVSLGFPPLPSEGGEWDHLPRLVLPGGAVLTGERWSIGLDAVTAMAAQDGFSQYLAWRREAERLALPALVWVGLAARPDVPPLLLRTDSPLAVTCLFRWLGRQSGTILFTEAPGDRSRWPVRDAARRHYVSEIAVSWFDDRYWSAVPRPPTGADPSGPPDTPTAETVTAETVTAEP